MMNQEWWKSEVECLFYSKFQIKGTEVLIGLRPDRMHWKVDTIQSIQGWLSVTDRFVNYPVHLNARWFPWKTDGAITHETIFGALKTLHYWIDELKLSKIYIHCDSGQMRSPSIFGLYLLVYHPEQAQKICEDIINHKQSYETDAYILGMDLFERYKKFLKRMIEFPNASLEEITS